MEQTQHSETHLHISKSLHMNNAKITGERRVFLLNDNPFEGKGGLYFGPYKNFCRNTSYSVSAKKDPVTYNQVCNFGTQEAETDNHL